MPYGQNQDRALSALSLRQDYSGTSTASSATFRYTVSGSPIKALGDVFRENNDSVGSSHHVRRFPKQIRKRFARRSRHLPLGAALRRERRAARRFPGGDRGHLALGGVVQGVVGARRRPRGDGQQGARRGP